MGNPPGGYKIVRTRTQRAQRTSTRRPLGRTARARATWRGWKSGSASIAVSGRERPAAKARARARARARADDPGSDTAWSPLGPIHRRGGSAASVPDPDGTRRPPGVVHCGRRGLSRSTRRGNPRRAHRSVNPRGRRHDDRRCSHSQPGDRAVRTPPPAGSPADTASPRHGRECIGRSDLMQGGTTEKPVNPPIMLL